MSIPSTCLPYRQDPLFYVLYGANDAYIRNLIEEAVIIISREHPTPGVLDALHLVRPGERDSLNCLRVRFCMLLNESEGMRARLAGPQAGLLRPLCPHKATRFYDELCDELLPPFIQCEPVPLADMVDRLREAYLHS